MIKGLSIPAWKLSFMCAVAVLVSGCAALPSMQYCDEVRYIRKGTDIHVEATCRAPVGGGPRL